MRRIDYDDATISIHLESGLNIFESMSAIGKTYLPSLLKDIGDYDSPIFVHVSNMNDYRNILVSGIDQSSENIIYFFDRADLFMTEQVKELIVENTDAFILVDCKHRIFDSSKCKNMRMVSIDRENGRFVLE